MALDRLLTGAGLTDACRSVACGVEEIDRVMIRSSARVELTVVSWEHPAGFVDEAGEPLSDHEPVTVRLRWALLPEP